MKLVVEIEGAMTNAAVINEKVGRLRGGRGPDKSMSH